MKKLVSLLFGACGLLYGVPSQAEVLCCPANKQCGDVCCPTKGCNADRNACAENVCERGIFDYNGYCCDGYLENGNCVSSCSSGYIENGYNCIECSGSGYGAYDGYCVNCSDMGSWYGAYNGQCVYCSNMDSGYGAYDGQCVNCSSYGMGAYGGQCVNCSDHGLGAYDGQCRNCSSVGSGYGAYDGYCVNCSSYGMGAYNGECVDPGYLCPSGFVPGYDSGTCCGDGYGYNSYIGTYYEEYNEYENGWSSPQFRPEFCGCPRSDCGFHYDGSQYCQNSGYTFFYSTGDSFAVHGPEPGHGTGHLCPDFSGYDHVWNPNIGSNDYNYNCCYTDGSHPFRASISYEDEDNVMDASCDAFEPYLSIYPWCCPQGYAFYDSDNRCVPTSACGYINDVFCGGYNGGYSCMPMTDGASYSFSEDGYTFSSSCCEASGGYAISGYSVSSSGLYHGYMCCPGGSDTTAFFFDSGSSYSGNYSNPWSAPSMSDCIFHASTSAATETLTNWLNYDGPFPRYEWAEYLRNLRSSEHPSWRIATHPNGYGFCICDGYDAVGGSYAVSYCASACGYGY